MESDPFTISENPAGNSVQFPAAHSLPFAVHWDSYGDFDFP